MKVIIIGDGGHSRVIQDVISYIEKYEIVAILDDKYTKKIDVNGVIYGPIFLLNELIDTHIKVVAAIGDNTVRKSIIESIIINPNQYVTVIHPSAIVSRSATIETGTVIMPNVVINAGARIGSHCIINTGSIVEHDATLGDFVHLSPNGTITGNVCVGDGVHIGSSAVIIPGITIGKNAVIGAGSTVIKDIPANSKAVGSPTRIV